MTGPTVVRRLVTAVLAMLLVLSSTACNINTATAPTGELTLHAAFDDVEDLTVGHNVQSANVVVGSIQDIGLDGYRARVRMSIVDGRRIPVGTSAVIRHTSVLGEAYVDLVFPASFDPEAGPFLADDAEITETDTQDGIEQLAQEAAGIVGALAGSDLAELIETGSVALDGRGGTLNRLVDDAALVADTLASQSDDLAAVVDGLARIGAQLAPQADTIGSLVDELASATATVAGSRDRMVEATQALVGLAAVTTDAVLVPHAERLEQLLAEASPLLRYLADRSDVLATLISDLLRFTDAFPTTIHNGQVLLLTWAFVDGGSVAGGVGELAPLDALQTLVEGET